MDIKELVDNFELLEDWEDKYAYLISLGDNLPPMEDCLKTEESMVNGCLSQVWLILSKDSDGKIILTADSDAKIVRGLVAILSIVFNGKTIEEARSINIEDVFKEIGLDEHLSPNRRNGFFSMLERLNAFIATNS